MTGDMDTGQLLAWAGHCLTLVYEQADDSVTRERADEARAIVEQLEEYEG